jgi:hypothetical protein
MPTIKKQTTEKYTLSQDEVRNAVAFYINHHYGTEFTAKEVAFDIEDSNYDGGMGGFSNYNAAYIKSCVAEKITDDTP